MLEDGRNSHKKAWKAFQANYDYVFGLSDRKCCYSLTDQQVSTLLSMTEYLSWPSRWISTAGEIDRDLIDAFTSGLETNLMSGCCDDQLPIQWRYSSDGTLQMSSNGGGTWADAPLYDPRVYSPQFPPMTGDDGNDKKCIAATGAAALVKDQLGDQITGDLTRYTLNQLITDWVRTMIDTSNPFQALLTVISNQIFSLVLSALSSALTDPVYDTFKCILYCNIGDDATVNLDQWATIRSEITDMIGGIAGIFLEHLIYLLGTTGTTNLLRAGGAAEGDCSDCDCGLGCANDWMNFGGSPYGSIDEVGSDFIIATSGPTGYLVIRTADKDSCCVIVSKETLSGADPQDVYWTDCGVEPTLGVPQHGGLFGYGSYCVNYFQLQAFTPFTVKLIFANC